MAEAQEKETGRHKGGCIIVVTTPGCEQAGERRGGGSVGSASCHWRKGSPLTQARPSITAQGREKRVEVDEAMRDTEWGCCHVQESKQRKGKGKRERGGKQRKRKRQKKAGEERERGGKAGKPAGAGWALWQPQGRAWMRRDRGGAGRRSAMRRGTNERKRKERGDSVCAITLLPENPMRSGAAPKRKTVSSRQAGRGEALRAPRRQGGGRLAPAAAAQARRPAAGRARRGRHWNESRNAETGNRRGRQPAPHIFPSLSLSLSPSACAVRTVHRRLSPRGWWSLSSSSRAAAKRGKREREKREEEEAEKRKGKGDGRGGRGRAQKPKESRSSSRAFAVRRGGTAGDAPVRARGGRRGENGGQQREGARAGDGRSGVRKKMERDALRCAFL